MEGFKPVVFDEVVNDRCQILFKEGHPDPQVLRRLTGGRLTYNTCRVLLHERRARQSVVAFAAGYSFPARERCHNTLIGNDISWSDE